MTSHGNVINFSLIETSINFRIGHIEVEIL